MPKLLSPEQVERYQADGFVHPVSALSAEEAADVRSRFEAYEAANDGWYENSAGQKLYLLQTWAAGLVSHPIILDAVEDVLGPDIMAWGLSLFIKDAGNPAFVSWHQDSTYWGLSKPDVVTAWIALTPATKLSGCMKMMPGTHKWDQVPHKDTLAPENMLTRGQEVAVDVDENDAVFIELQPGEISLHNIRTVHGSEPNRSDGRRIGIAVRYIAPHVKQLFSDKDSVWLVRGEDKYGHFVLENPPDRDMDPAAIAENERIKALRKDVLYRGVEGAPAHEDI